MAIFVVEDVRYTDWGRVRGLNSSPLASNLARARVKRARHPGAIRARQCLRKRTMDTGDERELPRVLRMLRMASVYVFGSGLS